MMERKIASKGLTMFTKDVLREVGLSEKDAGAITDSLIDANLRGVDSHGIMRLPLYVRRFKEGIYNMHPRMEFVRKNKIAALLDGDNGIGQVVGIRAVEEAIKMATDYGVGLIGVRNSNHFGAAAFFGIKILEADYIGIVLSNAPAMMVPYGGARRYFGTNPLAFTVPAGEELPIVVDMSTSVVSHGKIILADKEGKERIPEGWAVDREGNPTTKTKEALEGALLPFGGYKGSAIALMVEIFSGIITGASWGPHLWDESGDYHDVGHFIGAINVEGFLPLPVFKSRVDQIIREIKAVPPAPGFKEVCLPGEIEFRTKEERLKNGIPVCEDVFVELCALGNKYGKDLQNYIN